MSTAPRPRTTSSRAMHPLFVELFMTAGDDALAAEERRRARRARRTRVRMQRWAQRG